MLDKWPTQQALERSEWKSGWLAFQRVIVLDLSQENTAASQRDLQYAFTSTLYA